MSAAVCPVLVGPTAVGKTGLIVALAGEFPIEVISLDSRQIYHGLRIGTAQPSIEEHAVCAHHLVDFLPPTEKYSTVRFRADFERTHHEITARGRLPVLVGGAGLYLTGLREGLFEIPAEDNARIPEIRAQMDQQTTAQIRSRLQQIDLESHRRIHPHDRYRSQRALEIFEASGKTKTELMAEQQPQPSLGLEFPSFYLTRPRELLNERIARRTGLMLTQGWLEEVEDLLDRHPADSPGLLSIGYQQIVQYLQGQLGRDELEERIVVVTRQYAKRQRTWFRTGPHTAVGEPEDPFLRDQIRHTLAAAI